MAKKSYIAESRLSYDGTDVLPGETISMDEDRAASLVDAGVLTEISAAEKRKKDKDAADLAAKVAADAEAAAAAAAKVAADDEAAAAEADRLAAEAAAAAKSSDGAAQ